jgi:hypothetical protein
VIKVRNLNTIGALLVLVGLLASPAKMFALRCRSNPMGWFGEQCEMFRETHTQLGYPVLIVGVLLIAASFYVRRNESKND